MLTPLMQTKISTALQDLEAQHNVSILLAVESGSRAWGFASPDSDYDVRFIYRQPLTAYLSITARADTINLPISSELDIGGWDLRKTLRHLVKSNAVLFEWIQAPHVYRSAPDFQTRFAALAQTCFSPRAVLHHYLGLFKKFYPGIAPGTSIRLKRIFYILRALLAAWWIIEKKTIPPVEFGKLCALLTDNKSIPAVIANLLAEKAQNCEHYEVKLNTQLYDFIESTGRYCLAQKDVFPVFNPAAEAGDIFFREWVDADHR